jgi:GT2 family glycosyltransferase
VLCDNLAALPAFFACTAAGERPFLPALTLSIRTSLFQEIHGFDEAFAPTGEDADLSFRLRRRGYRLWFEPAAMITHYSARFNPLAVWQHMYAFGAGYPAIQARHSDLMQSAVRLKLRRRWALVFALLSPGFALFDSLRFYRAHPRLLRYWYALPGVVWGRLAWYLGQVVPSRPRRWSGKHMKA